MASIADQSINFYKKFTGTDGRVHTKAGKEDGARDIPPSDATSFHTTELAVVAKAEQALNNYDELYKNQLEVIDADIEKASHEIEQGGLADSKEKIIEGHQNALTHIENTHGKTSLAYKTLKQWYDENESTFTDIGLAVRGRPLQVTNGYWYVVLLFVLSVLEIPINQQAFAWAFEDTPLYTYGLAFGIGLFFVLMAHMTGKMFRGTGSEPFQNDPIKYYAFIFFVVSFVLVLMYFLAMIRMQAIEWMESPDAGIDDILKDNGIVGVVAASTAQIKLDTGGIYFMLMNMAVFVAGAMLAFYRHDPHPYYEHVSNLRKKYSSKMSKMDGVFTVATTKQTKLHEAHLQTIEKRINSVEENLAVHISKRESFAEQKTGDKAQVGQVVYQQMLAYQGGNKTARKTTAPSYFGEATRALVERALGVS